MTDTKTILIAQLLISGMMAFFMTGFFGFLHFGPTSAWLHEWRNAFVIAWPVAFCLSIFVGKLSFKIAGSITGSR
jgi:hypothetical protein